MNAIEAITSAIAPVIKGSGYYLEEVTLTSSAPKILTVVVDSDTHLNLDQVTIITKEITELLENLPELGNTPFTLEVTSPGIDRPLTLSRHWQKNFGRLVTLTLNNGDVFSGRIGVLTDSTVTIDEKVVPLSDIKRATLEVEFKSLMKDSES